jgi:hypothetical protein
MIFRLLVALSASVLLLTGCSSASTEPKYDEVDLIQYQACLDKYSSGSNSALVYNPRADVEASLEFCKYLLPVKK